MNLYSRNPSLPGRYNYVGSYRPTTARSARPQPPKRHHFKALFVVLLVLMIGGYSTWNHYVSAHALEVSRQHALAIQQHNAKIATIAPQINQLLADNPTVSFGIAIQEVDATYPTSVQQFGGSDDFDAASVGKLMTAADYLQHVEQGNDTLSQKIDGKSAQTWLRTMIVNSDDTAWQELNDYLTHADLARYAESIGVHDYDVDDNQLSPNDIVNMLGKLWQGNLLNAPDKDLLLSYLKQANYRDYIVPAVPSGDGIYHKVGIDGDEVNDVAIITHGQQTVVISIFTNGNGTYDWPTRAKVMQQITQLVLSTYFSPDSSS